MTITSNMTSMIAQLALLLPIPLIIFSATPRMSMRYKSGRIIFIWALVSLLAVTALIIGLTSEEVTDDWGYRRGAIISDTLLALWSVLLINIYTGWWELLWRLIYRQWTWPIWRNVKEYGIVSNLCILGSMVITIPAAFIILLMKYG